MKVSKLVSLFDYQILIFIFFVLFSFDENAGMLYWVYIGFILLCVLSTYKIVLNGAKIHIPHVLFPLFIFYLWCWIGALVNYQHVDKVFSRCLTITLLYAVMIIMYNYLYIEKNADTVLLSIYIAGLIFSIYVIQVEGGFAKYVAGVIAGRRMGSVVSNVNSLGLNLCFAFASGCYLLVKTRNPLLIIPFAPLLLVAGGTGSRKVLLFLAGFAVVYFAFYVRMTTKKGSLKRLVKYTWIFLLLGVSVFLVSLTGFFDTILDRFSGMAGVLTGNTMQESSADTRMDMIRIGFIGFREKPVFGYGLSNSGTLTSRYLNGFDTYLHNNYVELLATTGIVGFLFYYLFYALILIKMITRLKERNLLIIYGVATLAMQFVLEVAVVSYFSKRLAINTAIWLYIAFCKSDDGFEKDLGVDDLDNNVQSVLNHGNVSAPTGYSSEI